MTDRNLDKELFQELENDRPQIEGYDFVSADPIGNLIYGNDGKDGKALGSSYKVLVDGDIQQVQDVVFQIGNPANGLNGLTTETLIEIAGDRTIKRNANMPHWHNNFVIDGLTLAANALNKCSLDRMAANVFGEEKALPRKGRDDFHPIVRRLLDNQDKFNFGLAMLLALSESYSEILDPTAQGDFIEMTPEGPKRKIDITPEEEEAITLAVSNSQKLLAVVETSELFQTILGTMVHGKKLQGMTQQSTTPTSEQNEQPSDSTQEQT